MGKLLIISGAGTGVDSGITTFRTDTVSGKALWGEYSIDDVCNYQQFQMGYDRWKGFTEFKDGLGEDKNGVDTYTLTNDFYNKRRVELAQVQPNIFHHRVAALYKQYGSEKVVNITTNVDDLLERAGIPHEDILHVHGYLPSIKYRRNGLEFKEDVGYNPVDINKFEWVKPDVIFFGEVAPMYGYMYAQIDSLADGDIVVVVGCSNQVINFNWELFPKISQGVKMVVVNPDISYGEQIQYEERGVIVCRSGSSEVWNDDSFIYLLKDYLDA